MERTSQGKPCLYHGMLIQWQSYLGHYPCPCGRVAMSDGDGMASSTQILVVGCTWVFVAMSCCARH
jgi:hypothetical protein